MVDLLLLLLEEPLLVLPLLVAHRLRRLLAECWTWLMVLMVMKLLMLLKRSLRERAGGAQGRWEGQYMLSVSSLQQQHGATAQFSHGRCDAPVSLYELERHSLLPFAAAACLDPEAPPVPLPMLGRSFGLSPGTAYSEKTFLNCEGVAVERESAWMLHVCAVAANSPGRL